MSKVQPPDSESKRPALTRRRLASVALASLAWGLLLAPLFDTPLWELWLRTLLVGMAAFAMFLFLGTWPRTLPGRLARWVWQVAGVALAVPLSLVAIYRIRAALGPQTFWEDGSALSGLMLMTVTGLLIAPWIAVAALMRARDAAIGEQARAFERERGELERTATEARLQLLQAQVQPHFLFNTLANVRELVASGSDQAVVVLDSLTTYLRTAVPRLDEPEATLGRELALVRAYLELMQMRLPDRLQFSLHADAGAEAMRCPPLSVLTLVENAVRHGIDPSEEGGRIDVGVHLRGRRCHVQVSDTGVGLTGDGSGTGTGLATLQQRLHLAFAKDAGLTLSGQRPRGVVAIIEFPAEPARA
jgi:hypothetical protein